jgi:hypothetical protein
VHAPVPSIRPNANAFYLLGIAAAVSAVLAFPTESALHKFVFGGTYWDEHSCGAAVALLNRGPVLQALLTPLFVFLLPGAGSLFHNNQEPAVRWRPKPLFAAGCVFAAVVPIVWWFGFRSYAVRTGLCEMLFDRSRFVDPLQIDDLKDSYHYFVCLSVFETAWAGTIAAGLRLQSARESERGPTSAELRAFRDFFWVFLLGWAVQYRISLWGTQPNPETNQAQEWLTWAGVTFTYLTASSLWTLAFVRWFWKWRVRTWWASVGVAFAGTYAIDILTMITFFWLFLWAPLALIPLGHWNIWGMMWALTVGTWRWHALRQLPRTAVPSGEGLWQAGPAAGGEAGSGEQPPALAGLKMAQTVGTGIAIFLLLALLYTAITLYIVMHQRTPHSYP